MTASKQVGFQPLLEVKFHSAPRPIFIAALAPQLWKISLPGTVQDEGYEEELKRVVKIFKKHYRKYKGRFGGFERGEKMIGFRYYRSRSQSILFDHEGKILQVDHEAVPETQCFLRIK